MKRVLAVAVVVVACLSLTACDDGRDKRDAESNRRYQICVENGGSWIYEYGNQESCVMPGCEK